MAAPIPAEYIPQPMNQLPQFRTTNVPGTGFWNRLGQVFSGSPARIQQIERFTPQQQALQNRSIQEALGILQNLRSPETSFNPIEQYAQQQYQQKILPHIAERFTASGGRGSSSFNQAVGQSASDLANQLAMLRSQYNLSQQRQQQSLLPQLLQLGMQEPTLTQYQPQQASFLEDLIPGLAQTGINVGANVLTGGISSLIPLLMSLFGGNRQQQQTQSSTTPTLSQRVNALQQRNNLQSLFPSSGPFI